MGHGSHGIRRPVGLVVLDDPAEPQVTELGRHPQGALRVAADQHVASIWSRQQVVQSS